jgi:hypothetical protein
MNYERDGGLNPMKRCGQPFLSSQRFIEDLTGKNLFYQGPVRISFVSFMKTGP